MQDKGLQDPLIESSKEGSYIRADVSLGILFMGFKKGWYAGKRRWSKKGYTNQEEPSNEAKMIKAESPWGMYASKFKSCHHIYWVMRKVLEAQ